MDENTKKRLIESIKNKDDELFALALRDFYQQVKGKTFDEYEKSIDDIGFSEEEKTEFFIKSSTSEDKELSAEFRVELMPYFFEKYIENNKEEFYNMLKDNKELQEQYSLWFKKYPALKKELIDLYPKLFNLESMRNNVLNDNRFISNNYSSKYEFFSLIPEDYSYLISLYDTEIDIKRKNSIDNVSNLYVDKFSDKLSKKEILELIECHVKINTAENIFKFNTFDRMAEFEYCLKKISEDPTYYQVIKEIMNKTKLDMVTIMKFASKYDETELFKKIYLSEEEINKETNEKVKYLAKTDRIKGASDIINLDGVNLEELQQMEKEKAKNMEINLGGGPRSRTKNNFFPKYNNEKVIVRINSDGQAKLLLLPDLEGHETGVKRMYGDIEFPNDCTLGYQRAVYAAKQLSSITFIIENESCFIIIPDNMTKEQYEAISRALNSAIPDAAIGITLYNPTTDDEEFPMEDDLCSTSEAIDYFKEKEKKQAKTM
ncbi:MAG: hypothetical protein IKF36_06560 [Bacilli bacterium]|nr:hypothetical protein [Bacilli bacterium]